MSATAPFLLTFAVMEEARPFQRRLKSDGNVHWAITGMGQKNAVRTVRPQLEERRFSSLLSCGFAGALDPSLAIGDVLFNADADFSLRKELLAAGAREVRFYCASRVAVTIAEKAELRRNTGADAVEMESQGLRELAREFGIPSATVRVISDTAMENLPIDFNDVLKADGTMNWTRFAATLLRQPSSIAGLMRLQRQTALAAERLCEVLVSVLDPGPRR
jgi:adenosylhomocysteine nucleosidase